MHRFVDREEELKALEKEFRKQGFSFIVVTGRKRIGKSRLLIEFLKGKRGFRVQMEKRPAEYNLRKLNAAIGKYLNIPTPNFSSFSDAFEFLKKYDKILVVIDEFSYLIRYADVLAEFQSITDEILSDSDIKLIVVGSSFSIMKRGIFEYSSPLYGRSSLWLNLNPLKFTNLLEWFENKDIEEIAMIYGAVGGVPRYLEYFQGENAREEIKNNFFSRDSFLFREGREMLEEEFDEPEYYYSILESISRGNRRVVEIGNYAYMEAKNVAKYLKILRDLGIIRKIVPIGKKRKNRGIYEFDDLYFAFWFRFVAPYFEDIDAGFSSEAIYTYNKEFDSYMGWVMERIGEEVLPQYVDFKPIRFGKFWHKRVEIDLVVEGEDDVAFFEIKWGKVTENDAKRILRSLIERSKIYKSEDKRRVYGIFAKEVNIKENDVLKISLRDLV